MNPQSPSLLAALVTLALTASLLPAAKGQVATVNGTVIPQARLDTIIKARAAAKQPDSPEVRNALRDTLINQEVIAQEAVKKGLLKVFSKMGISTYQSYCGAQIFNAVGLSDSFLARYFPGISATTDGAGLLEIAEETVKRHRAAFGDAGIGEIDAEIELRLQIVARRRDAVLGGKLAHHTLSFGMREVDGDGLLAAIGRHEIGGFTGFLARSVLHPGRTVGA